MSERSIFLAALEITDPAERASYLERACGGDADLRRGVEELIAAAERSGGFLEGPALGTTFSVEAPSERIGTHVGPYKLLQKIGEGGMGVVFMAEQEEPVRRLVALKIIRRGMDSRSVLARFEAERQALAMMDHPNIARVLDAGTTESGSPFFVMELVKGVPITRFCDERNLGLRERLELFVPVCQAIQHAHQKGIIHRDIKPSNVLVALYDDHPVPKVIDFGVAKATGPKLTDKTLFTAFGSVVGTLEYMSPEQAKLNQLDIDTRSDVYALGVLLYELLTGGTPIDRARLASAAFDEVLRLIREEEPIRPSTRLSAARTDPDLDASRRVELKRLGHVLRGELDWIVMKALEKDRTRRYETANGLARDVQRYLADEPVEACPPTLAYRLRKTLRRNRAAVAVAMGFTLLLAGSALLATGLAVLARRAEVRAERALAEARASEAEAIRERQNADEERRRAEEERRSAQAVRDFLQNDLLGQASEFNQAETRRLGGEDFAVALDPTIGELLDRAAARLEPERIDARFPGLPHVQAEILRTVGDTYMQLGRREREAVEFLERAVRMYEESRGADEPAALDARHALATAYWVVGRTDEAVKLVEPLIADKVRLLGPHHPETVHSQILWGAILLSQGRPARAVEYYRPIVEAARTHLGPDHLYSLWIAGNYASALGHLGRLDEAFDVANEVVARFQENRIPFDHPGVEAVYRLLAELHKKAGRRGEAMRVHADALAKAEASGGDLHPATWYSRHEIAFDHLQHERFEPAAELFERNRRIPLHDERRARTLEGLAQCRAGQRQFDEAERLYRQALDAALSYHGPTFQSWWSGKLRLGIADSLIEQGKPAEAEPDLLDAHRDVLAGRDPLPDLLDAHRDVLAGRDPLPEWVEELLSQIERDLVALYRAIGRDEEASRWLEAGFDRLQAAYDDARRSPSASLVQKLRAAHVLANALVNAGRKEPVIPIFEQSLELIRSAGYPLDTDALHAYDRLRLAVSLAGRHDRAAELAAAVVERLRARPETPREILGTEVFALASHLLWGRRRAEAEPLLREALAMQAEIDPNSWEMVKRTFILATDLLWLDKFEEAETLLLESERMINDRIALAPRWEKHYPQVAAQRLVELYTELDRPEEAEKWRVEASKRNRGE